MFQYNVNTYVRNEELTYRTNDPRKAIADFLESARGGAHVDILNGCTGEVLAIANHPNGEKHCTDEMALMILGYMCAETWDEKNDEPACRCCGGPVNAHGVCQHCGVEDETLTDGEMVLHMIAEMGDLLS